MAFTPRTFDEILDDMIAYMQANTIVSDYTVGSVIRTILEAAATEDDEQYFQMTQLLDAFSYTTASGEDLDRRLADFNLSRYAPKYATGTVQFYNNNLIRSQISADNSAGGTIIYVFNVAAFPTPSPTITVRLGEGTTRVQNVTCTSINYTTNELTLSTPLIFNVEVGFRASLVSGTTSTVNIGTKVVAPATLAEAAKTFSTQEPAFILPGNLYSNAVRVRAVSPGELSNVGSRRITQFQSSPPFGGAGVTNLSSISGGMDRESDVEFRQRAVLHLVSLSRGTPVALTTAATGVTVAETGQRVTSSSIVEDFFNEEVIVYVDDGTGFTPNLASFPADSLNGNTLLGAATFTLNNADDFPTAGFILVEDGVNTELVEYISVNPATDVLTLATPAAFAHVSGSIVNTVDVVTTSAESGQKRFQLKQFPVVRSSQRIFVQNGGVWTEIIDETDYILNKGTGELQLVSGLSAGDSLVAHYDYYTGLIAEVQRVLEGNIDNPDVYPGYKAAGIFLAVEAPLIKRITVVCSISAEPGYREDDLRDAVRSNIESYINSLKIGEDVITSRIIDVAHNIVGVRSVSVALPIGTSVTILENELPVAYDSSGNSLVTVA